MHHSAAVVAIVGCACVSVVGAQPALPDLDSAASAQPTVITPARLRQSLSDVPASVTIISGDTLRQFGIRSVAEALRLVPGMAVTRVTGWDYRINYHGTNILSPRRMNVLIDGISVYRPAFSEVIWAQLPLVVEDIDRIEVTRGPNSAAYGPNSMLAVINIITRSPRDVERGYGAVTVGSQSSAEATGRAAFSLGRAAASITASRSIDSGYDVLARDASGHDSLRRSMAVLRADWRPTAEDAIAVQAAIVDGTAEVAFGDDFQRTYPDRHFRDVYLGGTWTRQLGAKHERRLRFDHARQRDRQSWTSCMPTVALVPELHQLWRANPAYAEAIVRGVIPSGGSPADDALAARTIAAIAALGARAWALTCVNPDQNTRQWRTDLELQDTYVVSEQLRFVAGAGLRRQGGESETFLGGKLSTDIRWVFGNLEARPARWLTLNAGGYYESNSQAPSIFSPRMAANFHIASGQTLRFVFSRGARNPDIQEQRTNWSYTFTATTPPLNGSTTTRFYQSRVGPGNLRGERITSKEAGYLLNLQPQGLLLDVKVFRDELTHLISERANLAGLPLTNVGSVTLQGAEVQIGWTPSPSTSAFLNYAYLDNAGATKPLEQSQYLRHSGAVGVSYLFGGGWRGSLAYYGSSGNGLAESRYGRLDLVAAKAWQTAVGTATATVGVQRLDNPVTTYASGPTSRLFSRFDSRLQGFAQVSLRLP